MQATDRAAEDAAPVTITVSGKTNTAWYQFFLAALRAEETILRRRAERAGNDQSSGAKSDADSEERERGSLPEQ